MIPHTNQLIDFGLKLFVEMLLIRNGIHFHSVVTRTHKKKTALLLRTTKTQADTITFLLSILFI